MTCKRIAVILAGELRTWAMASKYIFKFYEGRAEQIDYYFVTWNVSTGTGEAKTVTANDITASFDQHGVTLFKYEIVELIGRHRTTFYNHAWLVKMANILKRETERDEDFVYDQVIDTRPDIYLRKPSRDWQRVEDFFYVAGYPENNIDQNGFLGIPDYYFRTSSYSNDIMAERYTFKRPTDHYHTVGLSAEGYVNHHWTIVEFLTKRMMYPDRYNEKFNAHSDYDYFCAIRPNFPEDLDLDSASTYGELEPLFKSWGQPYKHLFYGPNGDAPVVDL